MYASLQCKAQIIHDISTEGTNKDIGVTLDHPPMARVIKLDRFLLEFNRSLNKTPISYHPGIVTATKELFLGRQTMPKARPREF